MLVIAVDNDRASLEELASCISEALPRCILMTYRSSAEAMKFIEGGGKPDITFLETEMDDIDGITLAREIKSRYPRKNIIFCNKEARPHQDPGQHGYREPDTETVGTYRHQP